MKKYNVRGREENYRLYITYGDVDLPPTPSPDTHTYYVHRAQASAKRKTTDNIPTTAKRGTKPVVYVTLCCEQFYAG